GEPVAENKSFHKALRFVEKPNLETAQKYLASGDYRWNAGMFVWSCDSLFKALSIHQPVMAKAFQRWKNAADQSWKKLNETLEAEYPGITKISIDFALMEKAQNILAADANFLWDDLGSWPALTRHLQHDSNGNCSNTHCVMVDAKNNLIFDTRKTTPRTLISLLGIHDSVIVFTDDAVLIAAKSESQRIKEIVAKISADPEFKNLV
ncbi:MAG: mannose-1-phosphate guanyltransferase, partial [Verrucomicrobia bacterium]|nr:mannose-1-phosphate guanyltransferase [Verrucomicrobiota bacterium]